MVFRPVLTYEESIDAYFICDTAQEAQDAVTELRAWLDRFMARLPKYPKSARMILRQNSAGKSGVP